MKESIVEKRLSKGAATACILLTTLFWSTSGALIKMLGWNALVIAGMRSAIAAVVLIAFLKLVGKRLVVNKLTLLTAVSVSLKLGCFVVANKLTSSANVVAIQYTSPVFVLLLYFILYKQIPRRKDILVSIATIFGIVLLVLDQLSPSGALGNLLALICGINTAIMYVVTGKVGTYEETISIVAMGHALLAILMAPFFFLFPPEFTATSIAAILLLGIVQQGFAYILYGFAIRTVNALTCSLINSMEPLLNPIWVFVLVGELPGPSAVVGCLIVLGAITAWSVSDARKAAKQTQERAES